MEKKINNEELQSRREFFKRAAKAALPVVGFALLSVIPSTAHAVTTCENTCSGSCYGSCTKSCSGSCRGTCDSTCDSTCTGSCSRSCGDQCK